MNILLEKKN